MKKEIVLNVLAMLSTSTLTKFTTQYVLHTARTNVLFCTFTTFAWFWEIFWEFDNSFCGGHQIFILNMVSILLWIQFD